MKLNLLFFASLRERLGSAGETWQGEAVHTVADLLINLRQRGAAWAESLAPERPWRVAVNQEMADEHAALKDGDEVAFFPPVTGG